MIHGLLTFWAYVCPGLLGVVDARERLAVLAKGEGLNALK
jgi:hypothetical protein